MTARLTVCHSASWQDAQLYCAVFAGCQNIKLLPHLEGCPNFRKVDGLRVYGVAIPTLSGLRVALDHIQSALPSGAPVYWGNLREEPLIYISGRPFVVRDKENPFRNLEYTGALIPIMAQSDDATCSGVL
jgi:Inositol hexakisphosphate